MNGSNGFKFGPIEENPLLFNKAYIGGQWVDSMCNDTFDVINPAVTGHVIQSVPDMDERDTAWAVESARVAQVEWGESTLKERSTKLKKLHDLVARNADYLTQIVTIEGGKPLVDARGEVSKANVFHEWYSEEAKRVGGDCMTSVQKKDSQLLFIRQPIGVCALITPWNAPLQMISRKAAAALAAGCCVIVKPAEDTPLSALALAHLIHQAGFPPGVFNVVTCSRDKMRAVSGVLCDSSVVRKVSFTGSTIAGKWLYARCSQTIKKLSLELGGNAAFIVFQSADLDKSVQACFDSKFRNGGQTCICANRILVQEKVYDEFCAKLEEKVRNIRMGPPINYKNSQGPLINKRAVEKVSKHVQDAIARGGSLRVGGKVDHTLGPLYFEPTLIVNVPKNALLHREETFGPLAGVTKFTTESEVIDIANSVEAGLASYVYTSDYGQAHRMSKALEVGMLGINEISITPEQVPFGGIKESGLGREGSVYGIHEYQEIKYLNFNLSAFL
ncbi:glutarate-semialdehyde dehydrogenase-like isoform X2 [Convolutriloba macropyga]|uniref:glutarate-semialdehyde dehydrogenase-like isoform X2 n=1 Tax=Convolutriloba macropyga TaxID=536237 RepID=UPI003F51EE32